MLSARQGRLWTKKIVRVQAHVLHCLAGKAMFGYLLTLNAIHRISAPADGGQQNGGHKPDVSNPQHGANDMERMDRTRAN